jgi:hypothetical protein
MNSFDRIIKNTFQNNSFLFLTFKNFFWLYIFLLIV